MSNSDYWFELGYKSGTKEIESLRQQLSAAQAELEAERNRRFEGNRISSQEYNDSQKREVMLRDALKYSRHQCEGLRVWGGMSWSYHPFQAKRIFDVCDKALAATEPKP
ncbi:MAG: hypothetical protein IPG22_06285 [Acidobacteria bacterium]|nr:hypothetical protein [Acidobacteriota bacterium]